MLFTAIILSRLDSKGERQYDRGEEHGSKWESQEEHDRREAH